MGHFYFVRHGQSVWNVENKICGATDIALTEEGHRQADALAKKILEEKIQFDAILCSPLIRARDTAGHISEVTGLGQRIYNFLDELKEKSEDKTYLLVAHNGICRVICSYFQDMTNREYARMGMGNCEIRRFDFPD